jgi:Ca2+-binding EF-hand superfamily protein/ribosomal protein L21
MDHDKYLQIMQRIDKHVKSKMLKINSIFQQFDSSGDGLLSKKEFTKGVLILLEKAPFTITKSEIIGVFNTIDDDGSNEMSYKEFAKELRNSDPVRQAKLQATAAKDAKQTQLHVEQALAREKKKVELEIMKKKKNELIHIEGDPLAAVSQKAREFLQKNMQKAINLFRQMDTSGDNLIDKGELNVGMKKLGLVLTKEEFDGLWLGLDADGSGACDLIELESALRDTDPERKAALEKYSRPPKLKPRQSIGNARSKRDRRVPGSLSWIMSPSTPKTKLRPSNPGYPGPEVPLFTPAGTVSINFPTAYRETLPVIQMPEQTITTNTTTTTNDSTIMNEDGSMVLDPNASSSVTSPVINRTTVRLTESAYRRKRQIKMWKKIKAKNSKKHMATLEEKVLRCVAMREGKLIQSEGACIA